MNQGYAPPTAPPRVPPPRSATSQPLPAAWPRRPRSTLISGTGRPVLRHLPTGQRAILDGRLPRRHCQWAGAVTGCNTRTYTVLPVRPAHTSEPAARLRW